MTKSFNCKALRAFRKLGAVALITATLSIFFAACNQTGNTGGGGGIDDGKPKHAITFKVDGLNGTLKAIVVDKEINSEDKVEQGKTVTFLATPDGDYRVKEWKVDGAVVAGNTSTIYTHIVAKVATVTVSFEPIPPGRAIITLDSVNKKVKIKVKTRNGSAIQVDGCTETTLASDVKIELNATKGVVILIGHFTEIECNLNKLTTFSLLDCSFLKKFECTNSQLLVLNIQGCPSLQELDCYKNQLVSLDVKGFTSLQKFDCHDNQLNNLNVHSCTSLQELKCFENQLTTLDVQGLNTLKNIDCSKNQLKAIDVQGLVALEILYCEENRLTELDVHGLPVLKDLVCSKNQLKSINILNTASFKYLSCYGNKIKAEAMIEVLKALPARNASDNVSVTLYTEKSDEVEENYKDFNNPPELKASFDEAKRKNWRLQKKDASGSVVDI